MTIYFSGERFSTQHPEHLQRCILDARREKYYFYDCSSKPGHWGKLRKLLNVSSGNPQVSPHTRVHLLHVCCAFSSSPVVLEMEPPLPAVRLANRWCWLGSPFVYTSGACRGSVFIFSFCLPAWCLECCFPSAISGVFFLGIHHWLSAHINKRPWDSICLAGLRVEGEPHRALILLLSVAPVVSCSRLLVNLLSESTVGVSHSVSMAEVKYFLSLCQLGNPSSPFQSIFILEKVSVKSRIVYSFCPEGPQSNCAFEICFPN